MRLRVGLLLAGLALVVGAAPAAAAPASRQAAAAAYSSAARSEAKRQLKAARARFRRSADSTPPSDAPGAPGTSEPAAPGAPGGTAPGGSEPAPPPPLPAPGPGARSLQVRAGEFWLVLSKPSVPAGNVRVEFNNTQAEDPHDLHLVREDGTGDAYSFGELDSGEVQANTFALNAGAWSLFCALPDHAEWGMTARLSVSGS